MEKPLWMWIGFLLLLTILLIFDLGTFNKKQRISIRESLYLSAFYIVIALLFGLFVWFYFGADTGKIYYVGYLIEKSLSIDNIFVISLILSYFLIPPQFQYRVLFWGILCALVLRGIMIAIGAALVAKFHWILYLFGAFLVFTGFRMLFIKEEQMEIEQNPIYRFIQKHARITKELYGNKFLVKLPVSEKTSRKAYWVTPLFLALASVGIADAIFAVDSIPAIFAITTDPYIVFTSNIFAVLGLRALYFALAGMMERFKYLKYALSLVLIFIGSKIFIVDWFRLEKFPPAVSLGVTLSILLGGILFSFAKTGSSANRK